VSDAVGKIPGAGHHPLEGLLREQGVFVVQEVIAPLSKFATPLEADVAK
jgi:hypothetical protein